MSAMDAAQQLFADRLAAAGIVLNDSDRQLGRFEAYYRLLVEWNEKMNLTGITERGAVYEKHFFDSLTLREAVDPGRSASLADIGSGAGFPSIPLKIVYPHLKITIIDALAKRIRFLQEVVAVLGLSDVVCLHGRAEDVGRHPDHRDRYDMVTARAVARLAALNELCLPFARVGGTFVAMKGSDVDDELDESRYSAKRLNAVVQKTVALNLPGEGAVRHLVVMVKQGPTPPAYPRKAGLPLKQPLIASK